jgi:hypothetical protein
VGYSRSHLASNLPPHRALDMSDQLIDAAMARSLHAGADRSHVLFAWIIQNDPPEHPGKFVARFATSHPTIYVMVADTLAEIHEMLPPGLLRSERQPLDPPDVVEIGSQSSRLLIARAAQPKQRLIIMPSLPQAPSCLRDGVCARSYHVHSQRIGG